jgi:nucleolar protein 15
VKAKKQTGVVYLGHIPFGFFEAEMRKFFSQFGSIERIKLARNYKTARSRHFAFIEFANAEVAQIVADSMNNYMMFGKTLVCQYLTPEKVHPDTFLGSEHTMIPRVAANRKAARAVHNRKRTEEEEAEHRKAAIERLNKKRKMLAELGFDLPVPAQSASAAQAAPASAPAQVAEVAQPKSKKAKVTEAPAAPAPTPAPTPAATKKAAKPVEEAAKKAEPKAAAKVEAKAEPAAKKAKVAKK